MKNHKIANNSATTEAREKIRADLEPLEKIDVGLNWESIKFYLIIKVAIDF